MDFEQALQNEGTFVLKEGLDMSALGVVDSPVQSPANKSYSTIKAPTTPSFSRGAAPSTPVVVPPTPSPIQQGPSSSVSAASSVSNMNSSNKLQASSPSSSSSQELFYDAEDGERQINRRSLYRSPGTSSSPDLATLLRKAKERGEPVNIPHHLKKDKRRESPPPLPEREGRPRSSTTTSPSSTPSSPATLKKNKGEFDSSTRGFSKDKEQGTKSKSSVRNFFGKMLGQSSVRERSKTDATANSTSIYPSHPSVFDAFPPPVPPIPSEHRLPSTSPIADVFSSANRPHLDTSKPLPVITAEQRLMQTNDDSDDRSMVFVEKSSIPPPLPSKTDKPDPPVSPVSASTIKRRSLSVGQVDFKSVPTSPVPQSKPQPPPPQPAEPNRPSTRGSDDSALHGILDEFRGQLSQLDPIQGSLDLHDPSTPARQIAYRQKQGRTSVSSGSSYQSEVRLGPRIDTAPASSGSSLASKPSSPEIADVFSSPAPQSIVIPPRSSSLQTRSPLGSGGPPNSRLNNSRLGVSQFRSQSGPVNMLSPQRDANRLRVLHRSTASSSEPSLLPEHDTRMIASARRTSHQDLSLKVSGDLSSSRYGAATLSPGGDETVDLDTRGKELAARCQNENDDFLPKEKIAEWLGGTGRINKVTLHYYMDHFDFTGLRLDLAFRRLCAKLYLKGETQQVDRILEAFSRRYWECNPGGIYGSANIVHAVAYSLLLLNTDLHVAELSTRMSRNQFVRNTITAIQTQTNPSAAPTPSQSETYDDCSLPTASSEDSEVLTRTKRSDSITSWDSVSHEVPTTPVNGSTAVLPNGSTPSFHITNGHETGASGPSYGRSWEIEMESLLKEMYNAIKNQQILQPLGSVGRTSMSSLSPGGGIMRNRSLRAGQPDRLTTLKRGSIRGISSILSPQSGASPYSSNSSIDGRVSPSPSFAASTHEAMYGSSSSFLNPTLGFASNLSHTIIKEAQEDDDRSIRSDDTTSTSISISDEELALLGAPWAKEGMLCRKQYWESAGKRAKDKNWLDVFVVIQRGELNMFVFGENSGEGSGALGGGNWLNNAQPVGTVHLAHSLAHPLPPPGYNRQRPHCMVLTLSNGGVYFFQAGTEELVNEWVSTCNYWAARTSKEPLAGGVSNMEYGWSRVVDLNGQRTSLSQSESQHTLADTSDGLSVKSGKSGHSKFKWRGDGPRASPSAWSEKIFINDWKPPMPPSVASVHDEETQLEALRKHVNSMKKDLELHNELREAMSALYQPRTANAMKAQSNWEKKSQYLLTEIVKYDSYIDSLQSAMTLRLKKRGEKALERALNGAQPHDERPRRSSQKYRHEDTIDEEVEPLTPGPRQTFSSTTPTPSD
ncbi:Sec7 domain GEF [Coprinopsis cinerea okayama7|uniref:Sec7 domain GEF n=1 Tax=Coprinopsis cinerea (strain Okayama-7 / 130 / ATCC MYA-4618 / FGSC 9003) TaxID=240176 RepID=D6RLK7_COPC7|nr:Sec7 domain GEF [Coprinopsis cinerea okayama7\|eukprot:XP_002911613.1 Sec7 domain GEF [Coprinopsis cinerea okayama7\